MTPVDYLRSLDAGRRGAERSGQRQSGETFIKMTIPELLPLINYLPVHIYQPSSGSYDLIRRVYSLPLLLLNDLL